MKNLLLLQRIRAIWHGTYSIIAVYGRKCPGMRPGGACPTEQTPVSKGLNPSQALHTHVKHLTLISGPSHSSQALYTHLKPFSPISGPPHPPQVMHTHLRLSMPILGPLHSSLALYSHLRPHTPVPDPPATRGMVFHLYKHVHFTVCKNCR